MLFQLYNLKAKWDKIDYDSLHLALEKGKYNTKLFYTHTVLCSDIIAQTYFLPSYIFFNPNH